MTADWESINALEGGDKEAIAAAAARKQTLRDVTDDPAINAAMTPEELKSVMPEVLANG